MKLAVDIKNILILCDTCSALHTLTAALLLQLPSFYRQIKKEQIDQLLNCGFSPKSLIFQVREQKPSLSTCSRAIVERTLQSKEHPC